MAGGPPQTPITPWQRWGTLLEGFLRSVLHADVYPWGRRLAGDQAVKFLDMKAIDRIHGEVESLGEEDPFRVSLRLESPGSPRIQGRCSCGRPAPCRHSVAVAMITYLGLIVDKRLPSHDPALLPESWLLPDAIQPPELGIYMDEFLGGEIPFDEDEIAEFTGAATDAARQWWIAALESPSLHDAVRHIRRGLRLTLRDRVADRALDAILSELLRADNRIDMLDQIPPRLRYHTAYLAGAPFHLPREFTAFLESPEFAARREEVARRRVEQQFSDWLRKQQQIAALTPEDVKLVIHIAEVPKATFPVVHLELLLRTKSRGFTPRKSQAIVSLAQELRQEKRTLPPEKAALVRWLANRQEVVSNRFSLRTAEATRLPITGFLEYLVLWARGRLLLWPDDRPVRLSVLPARVALRPDSSELEWGVEFPRPGASPEFVALAQAHIFSDGADAPNPTRSLFVRREDEVFLLDVGALPGELVAGLRLMPRIATQTFRDTGSADTALSLVSDPQQRARLVAQVPVVPIVELRLTGNNMLFASCRAVAADGRAFGLSPLGNWLPLPAPTPSEDDPSGAEAGAEADVEAGADARGGDLLAEPIPHEDEPEGAGAGARAPDAIAAAPPDSITPATLLVTPAEADADPVRAWFRTFVLATAHWQHTEEDGPHEASFVVTPEDLRPLLLAWAQRPPRVKYLGNRAFRELVQLRSVPQPKIRVESSGINWLQVAIEFEAELDRLSFEEVRAALSAQPTGDLVLLRGHRLYRREELEQFASQFEALHAIGIDTESTEPQRVHALQMQGDAAAQVLAAGDVNPRLEELSRHARELVGGFRGIPAAPISDSLAAHLRPYQRAGVDFLAWAAEHLGGAVLADDMGLGKTLQTLALLDALRHRHAAQRGPSLVICPTSVAHNWRREAERFTPGLRVLVIERGNDRRELHGRFADYDLVIINYALARLDLHALQHYEWLLVCVDEAQTIKNPEATISRSVKALSARARIALTGTPIENRLTDLASIVGFAVPGYLRKMVETNAAGRTDAEFALRAQGLRARLRPVMLRRMKSEVARDLPPRIEERRDCEMNPAQRRLYLAEVQKARELLASASGRFAGPERIQFLTILMRLRQICCDPAIAGLQGTGSGKVEELIPLLHELLEGGQKILLFSQFVKMIEALQERFRKEHIPFVTLTGETRRRQEVVERFEADSKPQVFLVSLKAGGTGLNLMSASHVVIFDPWWNPAVEAQAIDRTHRIGQKRTVIATRLVTRGTIEERILELQERKRDLVSSVLEEEAFSRSLTKDDLRALVAE